MQVGVKCQANSALKWALKVYGAGYKTLHPSQLIPIEMIRTLLLHQTIVISLLVPQLIHWHLLGCSNLSVS